MAEQPHRNTRGIDRVLFPRQGALVRRGQGLKRQAVVADFAPLAGKTRLVSRSHVGPLSCSAPSTPRRTARRMSMCCIPGGIAGGDRLG